MTPEQFREFARVLPEPLLLVTSSGDILAANRPIAATLGCSRKAIAGQPLMQWVVEPPEKVLSYLLACAQSRQMVMGSLSFRCAACTDTATVEETEETLLICRTEGAVVQPATAETPARILLRLESRAAASSDFSLLNQKIEELTQEVNRRRQAQNLLLRSHEELRQAQMQMVQNEKMSALGNLVAGIAHEINNPIGFLSGSIRNAQDYLQDIFGHLQLYKQHYPQPENTIQENAEDIDLEFICEDLPKLLESMGRATERIRSISTSLRTFSRADTEQKVNADIHEGIDSTLLILKYRLKGNEHRPTIEVIKDYGELPMVECFSGQLNQALMNIFANAVDAFDEAAQQTTYAEIKDKPHMITVKTVALPSENAVEIRIRDNGKGMSEEVRARIFDHLFTTKAVGKGTGLGMAIAQQIVVEVHSGSLDVHSVLEQGSEFCLRLPIVSPPLP